MAGSPVNSPALLNTNLYNGQSEWQILFSGFPDYVQTPARNYDPAIGRFIAVDPSPESAMSMTTYQYAGNNPVMMNDPTGNLLDISKQSYVPGLNNPNTPNEFTQYNNEWDSYDQSVNNAGTGGGSTGSGGGFSSWDQIQATANYLLNNTPYGGFSTSYGTVSTYNNNGAALAYGYQLYADQGGTMSYAEVLSNYEGLVAPSTQIIASGGSQTAGLGADALLTTAWEADAIDPEPITKVAGAVILAGITAYLLIEELDSPFGDPSSWKAGTLDDSQDASNMQLTPQGGGPNNGFPNGPAGTVMVLFGVYTATALIIDEWNSNPDIQNISQRPGTLPMPFVWPQPAQALPPGTMMYNGLIVPTHIPTTVQKSNQ